MILDKNEILALLVCDKSGKCKHGFKLPLEVGAIVRVSDWNSTSFYNGSIFGLAWGVGHPAYLNDYGGKLHVLIAVNIDKGYIMPGHRSGNICKFRYGRMFYIGDRKGAIDLLQQYAPINSPIVFANQVCENDSIQVSGNRSTQHAQDNCYQYTYSNSKQIAKNNAIQIAISYSVQIAEHNAVQKSGSNAMQKAGNNSNLIAGNYSYQCAGAESVLTIQEDNKTSSFIVKGKSINKWHYYESGIWKEQDPPPSFARMFKNYSIS